MESLSHCVILLGMFVQRLGWSEQSRKGFQPQLLGKWQSRMEGKVLRTFLREAVEFVAILILVCLIYDFTYYDEGTELKMTTKLGPIEPPFAERDYVARAMRSDVRVLCMVLTGPRNHWSRARHVKATWGRRCNILLFMSSEFDETLPTVVLPSTVEGHQSLWGKTRESFRYVWEKYADQADWFLKADDDSFVILENLRYLLSAYDPKEPVHLGHKFRQFVQSGYMQGGSGYVLSKEALRRFVQLGLDDPNICRQDPGGAEDVEIGACMERLNCSGLDTRDSYGRHRFLPLPLETHLYDLGPVSKDHWFWHYIYYPMAPKRRPKDQGKVMVEKGEEWDCCSDTAVGFHKVHPMQMYIFDYLIYRMKPYGIVKDRRKLHGQATPAPPPDAQLKATPFPGPTDEDQRKAESAREREEKQLI